VQVLPPRQQSRCCRSWRGRECSGYFRAHAFVMPATDLRRGAARRVGKGAGTAFLNGRDARTPCPPMTSMRAVPFVVGTAHRRLFAGEMWCPAPLPTLQMTLLWVIEFWTIGCVTCAGARRGERDAAPKLARARRLSHRALSLISRPVSRVLYGATLAAFAPGVTRDGHSSGTPVARRLKQPTRTAGSGHRSRNRLRDLAPSLFGLAPGGVCHAADVAADAVRSYRTFSPLPRLIRNAPRRFVFCGTVPETGSPFRGDKSRRTLSGTVHPWSPDFPPRRPFGPCRSGRPAD